MAYENYDWLEIEEFTREEFDTIIYELLLEDCGFKVSSVHYGCYLVEGRIIEFPTSKDHGTVDEFYEKHKDDVLTLLRQNVKVRSRKDLHEHFKKCTKKHHATLADIITEMKAQGRDPWE